MNIQLIKGNFKKGEILELISQMIQVKIRFHENKIQKSHSEEDIKMREKRIRQLQHEFETFKNSLVDNEGYVEVETEIHLPNVALN